MLLLRKISLLFLVLMFSLVSCTKKDESKKKSDENDLIIAESEAFKIYASEAFQYIQSLIKATHGTGTLKSAAEATNEVVDKLALMYMVYDDAKQKGFLETDLAKLANKYFRAVLINPVANSKVYEEAEKLVKEEDIQEAYDRIVPKQKDKVTCRQIVLATEEEAKEVLKKAKANEDFIKLVREYSRGSTAMLRDGMTDPYFRGSGVFSDPKVEDDLFALNEGEIYDGVIESPLGYMICKVEKKIVVSDEEIEKLKDSAKGSVYARAQAKVSRKIKDKYKDRVKIFKGAIFDYVKALTTEDEDPGDPVIGSFDGLEIRVSTLNWGADISLKSRRGRIAEELLYQVESVYRINMRNFITMLVIGDYYKDIEVPEVPKRSVDAKIKEQVVLSYVTDKFKDVDFTEEDARQFYDDFPDLFYRSEKAEISIIAVPTEADGIMVVSKLDEGVDFKELALQYSIDERTRENDGVFGIITKENATVPENFMQFIFEAQAGDIIGPAEEIGANRFLVIKVNRKINEYQAEFEDAKDWIYKKGYQKKIADLKREYYESLKEKYPITKNEENIKKVIEEVVRKQHKKKGGRPPGHP